MSLFSLPDQTIPESEKTKEWHMAHPESFALFTESAAYNDERQNMLKYYRAYNAELSKEEREMAKIITCPNGKDLGVEYIIYPLIQTKVEQIVGEFMLRPIRSTAYAMDQRSKNKKYDEKIKMLAEELMRDFSGKMEQQIGFKPETANKDIELPEDIEEFFESDFKTIAEDVAQNLLKLFLDVNKNKQKFREYFTNFCITDRAHVVLDKVKGHTMGRGVHPLDCTYDIDPYKVIQDDHEYFFETYWLTENEIYNSFPNLNKTDKEEIKKMFESINSPSEYAEDSSSLGTTYKSDGWYSTENKIGRIRLVSAMWKSRKRITMKVAKNKKTGKEIYKKLKDDEKPRKNDEVKHIDGEMPRFCIMLGPNICLDYGVMEHRLSSVDDPYSCKLPVVSIVRDNPTGTSHIKSVAAKLYQLQQLASEILFEIRLAIRHAADSRVLVYDVAQMPKAFSKKGYEKGLNQVMHHVKRDKFMFINSADKGSKGKPFNQFTSLDLSQKGAIQDLFNGLAIIEDLASKFVGISPEREGQIGQYQTKGNADSAIRGSAARTEVIYTPFDEFIQALLDRALARMRKDYQEGEVIQFIFGEMKTKFLKLHKEFFEADFGIYLSDSRKDKEIADRIDAAAEMALSNSNTPDMIMGLIEVFEGDTANEKKAVFGRMLRSMDKLREEQQQMAQQEAEAQRAANREKDDKDLLKTRESNAKDVDVAKIYVKGKNATDRINRDSQESMKAAELAEQQRQKVEGQQKPQPTA
jgi:hypothetical protein